MVFARQPIFNYKTEIYGYELLYREIGGVTYNCNNGDVATSNVMAASFLSMGVREISGSRKAFINFTESMLLHGVATLFPNDQIVVEILEDVEPTEEVLSACKGLKAAGYTIALDDFVFRPGYESLIEIADIIKVDFQELLTDYDRRKIVRQFNNGRIKFLAEKIESHDDFEGAFRTGYQLFQGYYFAKPVITSPKVILPATMNHLNLIKLLEKEEPQFEDIARIIEKDVAFSYEILRIANTAYYYRGNKVVSVRQAAVLMGLEELKKWAFITALRKISGDRQDAVVNLSAQRAKALELLSQKIGLQGRKMEFYTLGIFSMLDVLTGCPMELLLPELPISEEAKELLLGNFDQDKMSGCFKLMLTYEKGEWNHLFDYTQEYAIKVQDVSESYFEAVMWTSSFALN